MTERLSDKNPCNDCRLYNPCTGPCDKWHEWNSSVLSKLAEYETAADEGRLVITPYKIGKILFLPRRGEVLPFKVVGTRIYENRTEIDLMYCGNNECYKFLSTHPTTEYVEREFSKTREEAEKALKEMEGKHE